MDALLNALLVLAFFFIWLAVLARAILRPHREPASRIAWVAVVADMDAAADHIHLIFYIWLEDNNGLKVADALKRAAARGVACRAMADGLGSRAMIRSKHWKDMSDAGVRVAGDWMTFVHEDIRPLLEADITSGGEGFPAQVIATGPTVRNSAMSETFVTLMHAARQKLIITTPYFVPNESMQAALCAAASRGVETTIIFPARNDSWQVAAASRSTWLRQTRSTWVTLLHGLSGAASGTICSACWDRCFDKVASLSA